MKSVVWPILLCGLLVLSGCTSNKPTVAPSTGTSDSSSSSAPEPPPDLAPVNETFPNRILLTECTGFEGSTHPLHPSTNPGEPPEGWGNNDPSALSWVGFNGFDCQRINVGSFERGPIRIVTNHHTYAVPPETCGKATGHHPPRVLHAFFINDPEIAEYLKLKLGMPTHFSNITPQVQEFGPIKEHTWTVPTVSGESTLTFIDDGTNVSDDWADVLFWPRGVGIGGLDFTYKRSALEVTSREGRGKLAPPMLMPTGEVFAGPILYLPSLHGEGKVVLFSDTQCEQTEPT